MLITLLAGQQVFTVLLGLALLAVLVAKQWSRWALRRVHYGRTLSQTSAFVGDTITLDLRITNRKPLGIPSLQCSELAPAKLSYPQPVRAAGQPSSVILERTVAVRPYEAVSWQRTIICSQRGLHTFGPTELTASDPFGMYHTATTDTSITRLLVYPQLVKLPGFQLLPQRPQGDRRAQQRLFTDPARVVGVRDYQPTDPFKTIHWGATARRGALQTRLFEPTSTLDLLIVLDLDTFEHYWQGIRPDLAEYLISVAATVASAAAAGGWATGLLSNAGALDSDELVRIAPSRNPAQLATILEALAKIVAHSVVSLPQLLRRSAGTLPWGATVVVISVVPSEEAQASLLRLAERGRRVRWLYGGEGALPVVPGVEVVRLPLDAAWHTPRATAITAA